MKTKKTIRICYAWTLLLVFLSTFVLKSSHYHYVSCHASHEAEACHHASVQQSCGICEFTMHKATEAAFVTFVPVIKVTLLHRYLVSMQTVYRPVGSINSHSPPCQA